jgi:hypothetical protein
VAKKLLNGLTTIFEHFCGVAEESDGHGHAFETKEPLYLKLTLVEVMVQLRLR